MKDPNIWIWLKTAANPKGEFIEILGNQPLGDLKFWLYDPLKPNGVDNDNSGSNESGSEIPTTGLSSVPVNTDKGGQTKGA